MLEPQYLIITLKFPDIIGQLIKNRNQQLKLSFPQFQQEFHPLIINQNRNTQQQLVKQPKQNTTSNQSTTQYNQLTTNNKQAINHNHEMFKISSSSRNHKRIIARNPYHYGKFQNQFQNLNINYPSTYRKKSIHIRNLSKIQSSNKSNQIIKPILKDFKQLNLQSNFSCANQYSNNNKK